MTIFLTVKEIRTPSGDEIMTCPALLQDKTGGGFPVALQSKVTELPRGFIASSCALTMT